MFAHPAGRRLGADRKGDWWYASDAARRAVPALLRRRAVGRTALGPEGVDETLLDLNEMARGQPFLRLGLTTVTRDAMRLAYTIDLPAGATSRCT